MSERVAWRLCIWVGLTALLFCAWLTSEIGYRVVYVFRITDLNTLGDGVQRIPYVVTGLALVWLTIFGGLRHYGQLTKKGSYVAFAVLLILSGLCLWLYVDWSKAVIHHFYSYMITIDRRPPDAESTHDDLGRLQYGSVSSARDVLVFPIDHTRLIRAHDHLAAQGYEVRYEDPGFAAGIIARYMRPHEDEPP